ncbi:MAG TPA: DUF2911 domain-containing protein [Saprospiraceae bacterium]|nr:DUF2911 domain-containing protein [Saprospiraceae bacterium]HNM26281.1 DUF2911 domain-containing protein [Saprospiraceae bacterium]
MFNQLRCFTLFALLLAATAASAQIKTPAPSPLCKFSQEVGLTKIEFEYSRPSVKGRKIFGDLVPFGELWRTGANASTKVTFGDDAKVGGQDIKAGTYALYTIPSEKEWTVIFYKNTTFWGAPESKDWKEEDVAVKVVAPVTPLAELEETLTIDVNNLRNNSASIDIRWENTQVSVPVSFDVDSRVMADIKTQMEGPSANTYYSAARYYFEEKKDMKQALDWVNVALEKGGEKFWILRLKANIQAELGMYKDAIATAERSTALAKAEGNADYPRMNDKSIAEWKKKK